MIAVVVVASTLSTTLTFSLEDTTPVIILGFEIFTALFTAEAWTGETATLLDVRVLCVDVVALAMGNRTLPSTSFGNA